MFTDINNLPDGSVLKADICIVGAGAAGITLAREFKNSNLNICLLESGSFEYEPKTQSLYEGENTGYEYWPLNVARLRYFGGTTNHWGGVCLPLEKDDFDRREWVDNSGWPITRNELDPYYERAHPVLQLGDYDYTPEGWATSESVPLPFSDDTFVTRMLQSSPPTRFGMEYRDEISRSSNIQTYFHANVVDIETDESGSEIKNLHISTLTGKSHTAEARMYILASGGIENARLLLLSDKQQKNGLGNQNDLVGRYFADHPYLPKLGFLVLNEPNASIGLYSKDFRDRYSSQGFLTLSPEARKKEKLLVSRIHIGTSDWSDYSEGNQSLKRLQQGQYEGVKGFAKNVLNLARDVDDVARYMVDEDDTTLLQIGAWTELVPDKNSRVSLSEDTDDLGLRKVTLDWRIGDQEKTSLIKTLDLLASEIGASGLGRVKIDLGEDSDWPWNSIAPGLHHIGTTRMHENEKEGVVDQNCKVHGLSNLYIAGSSVFPTTGHANPTFTIVALGLRLADHAKEKLS